MYAGCTLECHPHLRTNLKHDLRHKDLLRKGGHSFFNWHALHLTFLTGSQATILLLINNHKTTAPRVDFWWMIFFSLLSHCLPSVISSTTYHFKTVGLGKTFDSFKPIFDWHHGYCDIVDIDGMCKVDLPCAFQGLLLKKEENRLRKPRGINKGEESADAAVHEELHYLLLDLCLEDKEMYKHPCLPVSFL